MLHMSFEEALKNIESGEFEFNNIYTKDFTEDQVFELRKAQVAGRIRQHNAEVVVLTICAEAYYSSLAYSERVMILAKDFFDYIYTNGYQPVTDYSLYDNKEEVCAEVYLSEFKGKESDVYAPISVMYLTRKEVEKFNFSFLKSDGDKLENHIFNCPADKMKCQNNLEEYLKGIDKYVEVPVTIRSSQIEKLKEFIAQLSKEEKGDSNE